MTGSKNDTCENCRYWQKVTDNSGKCGKIPALVVYDTYETKFKYIWHITLDYYVCSSYNDRIDT